MNLTTFWDWIDKRAIDKHVMSVVILFGTVRITQWAMAFAGTHGADGNTALIIASVSAPYMALQAAAVKFYFEARTQT